MKNDYLPKILLLMCLSSLIMLLVFNYTPLDFYVNAGFIKGLTDHGEFTFVSGKPFYGFTSPLWIILNSLIVYLTGTNILIILKIIGMLLSLASIPLVFFLSKKTGLRERYVFIITLLWAINPYFLLNSVSGYETPLFTILVLLTVLKFDKPIFSGILIGLSILARPEGIFLLAIPFFMMFKNRRHALSIAVALLIAIVWLVYAQIHFGTFIQRPFVLNWPLGEPTRRLLPLLPFGLIFLFIIAWIVSDKLLNIFSILCLVGILIVMVPVFQNKLSRSDEFARTTANFLSILKNGQCNTLVTNHGAVAYLSNMKIIDYNGMLSYVPPEYNNDPIAFMTTMKPCYLLADEDYVNKLVGINLTILHSETITNWSILQPNQTFTLYKFNW